MFSVKSKVKKVKFIVVVSFGIAAWPEGNQPFGNGCFSSWWMVALNGRSTKYVLP